jgi:CheY-like chemotaxis protein
MNPLPTPQIGRILLVDDDPHVTKSLSRVLRPYCEHIYSALNGNDALEIVIHKAIDAIVSEVMEPSINGIDLCRLAKLFSPNVTTIMLSGKTNISDILCAKKRKIVDHFIPKPWVDEEIVALIRASLPKANTESGCQTRMPNAAHPDQPCSRIGTRC